ncbi:MAG: hypothetical protein K9N07_07610 [Candidatus Cloacimonetes bacterium]|nr:hypothetical protein [Candidatus Cloacimonadota bacterium]MCF8012806.1 hypothetical protein [Candidatus Woesearchaeota archaeon]
MIQTHKPLNKIYVDIGNGWQDISRFITKWDAVKSVTSQTDTASLNFDYNALQYIQSFDSSAKIKVLAGYDSENLKLYFDGLIKNIKKTNTNEDFDVEAEDYSVFMLNRVATFAFSNTKAIDIIKHVLSIKIPEYSWTDDTFDDHEFIVDSIAFEDKPIHEIIDYFANLIGADFWVTSDGEGNIIFHCKQRNSIESDFVLERGVNLKGLIFIEDKSQMANRVIVQGDQKEFSTQQNFLGTGELVDFYLIFRPHNVRVTVDGVPLNGGVEGISQNPEFYVDYYEKKITLKVAPPENAVIEIGYAYDIPIKVESSDFASINKYGEKVKIIKNKNISDKAEAQKYAKEYIKQFGKPVFIAEADAPASTEFDVGDVITLKDSEKQINNAMQVLECSYSFSKTDGFNSSLKLAQTQQSGTNMLKDIILRLKQLEEVLKGDVEIVTKLMKFEETITVKIKRISARKRLLPPGFSWSKEGSWNNLDWGIYGNTSWETFFESGDKDMFASEFQTIHDEALTLEIFFSPELDKIMIWSLGQYTKDSWNKPRELIVPTPTMLKEVIDELRYEYDKLSMNLSVDPNYSDATIWSLQGGSPPYWSKMSFTRKIAEAGPIQQIHDKESFDNLEFRDRTSFGLDFSIEKPMWSMNYTWSRSGIEISSKISQHDKYAEDLIKTKDKLNMAYDFLEFLDKELVFSRSKWSRSPEIEYVETEKDIMKEIHDNLVAQDKLSMEFNPLTDGFFWSIRGWNKDDWGNIPSDLVQQDLKQRTAKDDLVSKDRMNVDLTWSNEFKGWSLKVWGKEGWIKFEQPAPQESIQEKTEEELLTINERIGFESTNNLDNGLALINTKSQWSVATW